jgi:predicted GTPase
MESTPINPQDNEQFDYCGLEQAEFEALPKILLLGKTQNGKSSLIINLSHRDYQAKLKESIKVGDGISSCTSELSFVPVVLRNTN